MEDAEDAMNRRTFYDTLQIRPDAEPEVIDVVYRRLCRKYHPDVNHDLESEQRIRTLNEAYAVLGDPDRRKAYDRALEETRTTSSTHAVRAGSGSQDPSEEAALGEALSCVADYFAHLRDQHFHLAYRLLSDTDRKRIPLRDFLEWQEAVSGMFQIGDVSASVFRTHRMPGRLIGADILAEGHEIDLSRDGVQSFQMIKTLVREQDEWRIQLGYEDVRGLAAKFRLMAESAHPRVTDANDLLRLAEREAYLFKRYEIPFSLVSFHVGDASRDAAAQGLWEAKAHSWISHAMNVLRQTDVLAWTETGDCILLLAHTDQKQAQTAMRKFAGRVERMASGEGAAVLFQWTASQYAGLTMEAWMGRLQRSLQHKVGKRV